MAQNNGSNQDFTNQSDGFILGGGVTERKLTVTGGNPTINGGGANTYTMPSATDTLVGRASTDTLTNKSISSASNTFAFGVSSQTNAGSAGGTMYYTNLGGIKMLWGTSVLLTGSSLTNGSNWTFTFPTSFFTTIQFSTAGWNNLVGTATQEVNWNPISASSGTVTQGTTSTPSGNQSFSYLIIGN